MCLPKKFDLVHQTVSPRERVGSGDETIGGPTFESSLHVSDVSRYLMVSAKSSCRNITCELVPGSPPPFLFFVRARGEPGNEANLDQGS